MLRGTKAVVTGASRGIGFAIAKMLAENGCRVIITGRNAETLQQAADAIGENTVSMVWDASEIEKAQEKIEEAAAILGSIDIVVNNAGIYEPRKSFLDVTAEEWEQVIRTNTGSVYFTMQAAVKYMLRNEIKGSILNITSAGGHGPVCGPYRTSKSASIALIRGWGRKFAGCGITINGIAPGPVNTEMNFWHEGDPMEHKDIPYGRFTTPEEVAKLAMYLLSDAAVMTCGETVTLDGAYSIR